MQEPCHSIVSVETWVDQTAGTKMIRKGESNRYSKVVEQDEGGIRGLVGVKRQINIAGFGQNFKI